MNEDLGPRSLVSEVEALAFVNQHRDDVPFEIVLQVQAIMNLRLLRRDGQSLNTFSVTAERRGEVRGALAYRLFGLIGWQLQDMNRYWTPILQSPIPDGDKREAGSRETNRTLVAALQDDLQV